MDECTRQYCVFTFHNVAITVQRQRRQRRRRRQRKRMQDIAPWMM